MTHIDDKQYGAPTSDATRETLASEALAIFDEITTSETSWSGLDAIDRLARDIVLYELGLEDRATARQVVLLALATASTESIERAVAALRADRAAMLESVAEAEAERRAP